VTATKKKAASSEELFIGKEQKVSTKVLKL